MKKEKLIQDLNPLFFKGCAHRGLHTKEFTENGRKAFQNAIDHHRAIELDVHLTKDNQLIVVHDSDLKRVTGKEGIVEERTVKEIKDNYRLLDGEQLPTFQEVLALVNEQVPRLVELKTYKLNNAPLAKKAREELSQIKDKKNFRIIAFDPRALIRRKKTKIHTSLLIAKQREDVFFFRRFFDSMDIEWVMLKEKKVIRYQKKHLLNAWTIDSEDKLDIAVKYADRITFQCLPPELIRSKIEAE